VPTNPLQLGHEVRNSFESAGPIGQEPTELSPQPSVETFVLLTR